MSAPGVAPQDPATEPFPYWPTGVYNGRTMEGDSLDSPTQLIEQHHDAR